MQTHEGSATFSNVNRAARLHRLLVILSMATARPGIRAVDLAETLKVSTRTVFRDLAELRVKESDRVATVRAELSAVGARVETAGDDLVVTGGTRLRGAAVRSHGDHRVAMAMAVAGLAAEGRTRVEGWDAVATSYPAFAADLGRLR